MEPEDRHITVCKALHPLSLRLTISVHSTHFHPIFKAHLIFYHLRLDLSNGPFPSAFPDQNPVCFSVLFGFVVYRYENAVYALLFVVCFTTYIYLLFEDLVYLR
jgi:hypothetical protein